MKTYPYYSEDKKLYSFEIDNLLCSRRKAALIVQNIPEVKVLRKPKKILSWFREEVFCEFELNGVHFQIDEPYGDNSRYWIGPINKENNNNIEKVIEAFNNA